MRLSLIITLILIISCNQEKLFNPIGKWESNIDISELKNNESEEMFLGMLSTTKYIYEFAENNMGNRNATVMGMEVNSSLKWTYENGKIFVEYEVMSESKIDTLSIIDSNTMLLNDSSSAVKIKFKRVK